MGINLVYSIKVVLSARIDAEPSFKGTGQGAGGWIKILPDSKISVPIIKT